MQEKQKEAQQTLSAFVTSLRQLPNASTLNSRDDVTVLRNLLTRYNELAQHLTARLRMLLNKDEERAQYQDEVTNTYFATAQLFDEDERDRLIDERELGITKISQDIATIATIFRDLQTLVLDQGTMLDTIEHNVTATVHHLEGANEQLGHASRYQAKYNKKWLAIGSCICIFFILLVALIVYKTS